MKILKETPDIKVSVVIPYLESDEGKPAILNRCINSLQGYDELLIMRGSWDWEPTYDINRGMSLARGEFIVVTTDDIIMETGNIPDLLDPKAITCPLINGRALDFNGCFFVLPRWVYEKVGGHDERYFEGRYYGDEDYHLKIIEAGIPIKCVANVNILHPEGGRTIKLNPKIAELTERNKQLFLEKWGKLPT